jgi:integrase
VRDAIESYVKALAVAHKSTARDAELRANKLILPQLGHIRVSDLTATQLTEWRDRLAATPALLRSAKYGKQNFRPTPKTLDEKRARRATANRTWTVLRAALSRAFEAGEAADDAAWRRVRPFQKVDAARTSYLTIEECGRLINAAGVEFRSLLRAALETGARYGELSALRVRDYHRGRLHVARSKSGHPRDIVLSEAGIEFFDRLTTGRAADELMFTRDRAQWKHSDQARPMKDACAAAHIRPAISFHQLRHTYASHAAMNGMPLMVLAANLGHRTIAMVQKHYSHLRDDFLTEQVRLHAPRYNIVEDATNVVRLKTRRN